MRLVNVGWNFIGLLFPLIIAALSVPIILAKAGPERFGMLAIVWAIVGYSSVLDFGVGRALTQKISELIARKSNSNELKLVFNTAVTTSIIGGCVGMILIGILSFFDMSGVIGLKDIESNELRNTLFVLALTLPAQAAANSCRGVNEAYANFKGISYVRIALGIVNFGWPALVSGFPNSLPLMTLGICISKYLSIIFYLLLIKGNEISLSLHNFSARYFRQLVSFGGWFTLSSLFMPLTTALERLLIATYVSAAAVAHYVVPYEMVVQSLVIMGAITSTIYPYLSRLRIDCPGEMYSYFLKVVCLSALLMGVVGLIFFVFGEDILRLWIGEDGATKGRDVILILAFGLVPYSIETLCIAYLHSVERADITAKINLIVFPFAVGLIVVLIEKIDIEGVAVAWVFRYSAGAVIHYFFVKKFCGK